MLDFITIDVEGHELEVLQGFDLKKYRPRIVIIEETSYRSNVAQYMEEKGYIKFKRTGVNQWYARAGDADLVNVEALRQFKRETKKQILRGLAAVVARRAFPGVVKRKLAKRIKRR